MKKENFLRIIVELQDFCNKKNINMNKVDVNYALDLYAKNWKFDETVEDSLDRNRSQR